MEITTSNSISVNPLRGVVRLHKLLRIFLSRRHVESNYKFDIGRLRILVNTEISVTNVCRIRSATCFIADNSHTSTNGITHESPWGLLVVLQC